MMKRLLSLLIVLVLLAAAVYLVEKPRIEKQRVVSEGGIAAPKLFPGLAKDAVSRIEISDVAAKRTLEKKDKDWFVAEAGKPQSKADNKKVDDLLTSLTDDFTEDTLVSSNKEKQKTFQVDEESGTVVSVYTGGDKPAVKVIIGKEGPDYASTFVRKDGDERTFSVARQLSGIFGFDTNGWRDKHLWSFDPTLAVEAEFKDGTNEFHVKKGEKGWELLAPETSPANGVKIEAELKSLSELEGSGFSDKSIADSGLTTPPDTIAITLGDGTKLAAYFSAEFEGYINAYVDGKPDTILKIANTTFAPLKITALSQLKMEEKPAEQAANPGANAPSRPAGAQTPPPSGGNTAPPAGDKPPAAPGSKDKPSGGK